MRALLLTASSWSIIGLALSLVGFILIFRYGMPFRIRTEGGDYVTTRPTPARLKEEKWYTVVGWIGFALIVIGTFCQIAGAYLA